MKINYKIIAFVLSLASFNVEAQYYTGHVVGVEIRNYQSSHQFVVQMDTVMGDACDDNRHFILTAVPGNNWGGLEGHQAQRIIALVTTAFMGNKRIRVNATGCGWFVAVDRVMLVN